MKRAVATDATVLFSGIRKYAQKMYHFAILNPLVWSILQPGLQNAASDLQNQHNFTRATLRRMPENAADVRRPRRSRINFFKTAVLICYSVSSVLS
ncbi:MAG: hypothetical protein ABI665_27830, partial [Vicinamibacterales bacterium]